MQRSLIISWQQNATQDLLLRKKNINNFNANVTKYVNYYVNNRKICYEYLFYLL